ncbi:hypothetical protein SPFM15_00231 [Salmonella phage SPFM15]|nr:hypothetical protein SPFM5_00225 [Salmonella phage SPFM5]VFR13855.1 hypothetical protein SPFM15_00231 [Salmonella phage SPFM15]
MRNYQTLNRAVAHVGNTVDKSNDEGEWEALRNARTAADSYDADVEKLEQAASKAAAALAATALDAIGKGFEKVLQDFRTGDSTDTKEIATPAITALASQIGSKTLAGGQDFTAVAFLSQFEDGEGGQKVLALPGNAYVKGAVDVALFGTAAKKLRTLPQASESAVAITKTAEGTATAAAIAKELTGGKAKDAINKLSSSGGFISKLSIEGDFDVANSIRAKAYQEMLRKLGKQKKENIIAKAKELKLKYINVGKSAQKGWKETLKDLFKRFVELCKAVTKLARESYRRGRGMTKAAQEAIAHTEVAQESIRKRWAIDREAAIDAADEKIENGEEMPEEGQLEQLDGDQETLAADTERTNVEPAEENIDVQLAEVASIDKSKLARESVEATGDVIDGLSI